MSSFKKVRELSSEEIKLIRKWSDDGVKQVEIASRLDISQSTVSYQLKMALKSNSAFSKSRRGRKKITTEYIDQKILEKVDGDRFISGRKISTSLQNEMGIKVSPKTIKRRISLEGFKARSPRKVPLITELNKKKRIELAKKLMIKGPDYFKKVIWSDETKLNYFRSDGNLYCWRLAGEEFNSECTKKTVKFGGGGIMLWGCMGLNGVGKLVKIDGIMDSRSYLRILQENLVESAEVLGIGPDFIFQQDNDPKHTSRLLKEYFEENSISQLDWAPQSPDLNVIEHLWAYIKVKYHENPSKTKHGMFARILEIWNSIPTEITRTLVKSVYKRFEAVIRAKGGATRY